MSTVSIDNYNKLVKKYNDLCATYKKLQIDYSGVYKLYTSYKQKADETEMELFSLQQSSKAKQKLDNATIKSLTDDINELRNNSTIIDNLVSKNVWTSEPDVSGLLTFKPVHEYIPKLSVHDKMSYLDQNQFVDYLLSLGLKYKIGSAGDKIFTFKEKNYFIYGMKGNGFHSRLGYISEGIFKKYSKNILKEKYTFDLNKTAYVNLLTVGDFNLILTSYLGGNQYFV